MIIKIGTFFTLAELSVSETAERLGIDNTPTPQVQQNLMLLVHNVLDPLRVALGKPIVVTSGYRSERINQLVGGSATSDHRVGRAADIHQPETDMRALMRLVLQQRLPFDQMIDEFGRWVHLSYRENANRNEILVARYQNGAKWYSHIAPDQV